MAKLIYFTASDIPTTAEALAIARLITINTPGYEVNVRNGSESCSYASGIEPCDIVAGTIPTAFNAKEDMGTVLAARPFIFDVWPKTKTLAVAGTVTLVPVAVTGTSVFDIVSTEILANVGYVSSVPGKATVPASSGLVTGVQAGETVITATYTYVSGKTVTAECAVTVS